MTPYFYYMHTIYVWGHENKPQGYKYPEYRQLWMTGVGALSFGMLKETIDCFSYPVLSRLIANNMGDERAWERKVNKA